MTRDNATSRTREIADCMVVVSIPAETADQGADMPAVIALATAGNTEQLTFHLGLARRNGVTETELTEAITHLAFYAGWPRAMSAMAVAKQVLGRQDGDHCRQDGDH
ncbi:MAG: carboxymuconolactone decarboxylase family protein [Trebonia sp.]